MLGTPDAPTGTVATQPLISRVFLTFMISLESTKVNKDEEDDDEGEDGDNRMTTD